MELRHDITLKTICGKDFITYHFGNKTRVINFNDSASYLWKKLSLTTSFTYEDAAQALIDEYDVDPATANEDSHYIIDMWSQAGLLE